MGIPETSGAWTPERRRRRLRQIEDELLSDEADRMQAALIWKINTRLGRDTDPSIIERARRQPVWEATRARARESAWRDMQTEFGLLDAAQVARIVGSTAARRSTYATDARHHGRLLAVKRRHRYLYPAFQVTAAGPLPLIRTLRDIGERIGVSEENTLLWLTAPTTRWGDTSRPVDHLDDPESVVQAFEDHYGAEW